MGIGIRKGIDGQKEPFPSISELAFAVDSRVFKMHSEREAGASRRQLEECEIWNRRHANRPPRFTQLHAVCEVFGLEQRAWACSRGISAGILYDIRSARVMVRWKNPVACSAFVQPWAETRTGSTEILSGGFRRRIFS